MYCVVLNKIKDIYILRHIIYDIDKNDSLNIIKEKYYANYNKTSTDEFHLCQTKTEISDILSKNSENTPFSIGGEMNRSSD